MKRTILILAPALLIAGCCGVSDEQAIKTKSWGATSNVYCDEQSGMMMKEYFPYKSDIVPTRKYVKGYNSELVPCNKNNNDISSY